MAFLSDIVRGEEMKKMNEMWVGPKFTPEQMEQAELMEVWYSGVEDLGPDYTEFRLLSLDNTVIATKRVEGY